VAYKTSFIKDNIIAPITIGWWSTEMDAGRPF